MGYRESSPGGLMQVRVYSGFFRVLQKYNFQSRNDLPAAASFFYIFVGPNTLNMAISTGIPKGTRDFSPAEIHRRNFIFTTLIEVFRLYGYLPVETPAMENLATLTGKYGEEGDRLIFKILNSGDFLAELEGNALTGIPAPKLAARICEKALRYDLTVPFARYVVQHKSEISFPFRRYQVQPVWRADRPQKGRYREFYQCDVDVIGSASLACEAELLQIIDEGFHQLGVPVEIHCNHRKILAGMAEAMGRTDQFTGITTAVDKIEKSGPEKVREELREKGLSDQETDILFGMLMVEGTWREKIEKLKEQLRPVGSGSLGLEETLSLFSRIDRLEIAAPVIFNPALARGLNYYTGAIFEVRAKGVNIGSVCGGGRYDDLTGIFGMPGVSGVGVSFGADRIDDVMKELGIGPGGSSFGPVVLFANFGGEEEQYALKLIRDFFEAF